MGFFYMSFFRLLFFSFYLSGCFTIAQDSTYLEPPSRPDEIQKYYQEKGNIRYFYDEALNNDGVVNVRRITVSTDIGPFTVDYYDNVIDKSDDLIFVFPVLGGKKNLIEGYFANYFAKGGIDTAIVHRNEEFKNPANVDRLEELFQKNVVRDRLAISFFEKNFNKKDFATFGISRGAINVAMTAGVDSRLKHNVLALGGSDLVKVFQDSNEKRIRFFADSAMLNKHMTPEEFYSFLNKTIKTDPKNLAKYMDSKNTLMLLGVFDDTVPFEYGMDLRKDIGNPETIMLLAGHKTAVLFSNIVDLPLPAFGVFPPNYIETEAMDFYGEAFDRHSFSFRKTLFRILQFPLSIIGREFIKK